MPVVCCRELGSTSALNQAEKTLNQPGSAWLGSNLGLRASR